MSEHSHSAKHYIKLYFILLFLLVVSILGPELEIRIVTLITAFGIALVKAYIVAAEFMHLKEEKKIIHYMLYTMLIFMGVFFAGICADNMRAKGERWEKPVSLKILEDYRAKQSSQGDSKDKEH